MQVPLRELNALTLPVILGAVDDMMDKRGPAQHEAFRFIYTLVDQSLQPIHDRISLFLGTALDLLEKTTVGVGVLPLFHSYLFDLGTVRFWPPRSRPFIVRHSLSNYLLYTTAERDDPFLFTSA